MRSTLPLTRLCAGVAAVSLIAGLTSAAAAKAGACKGDNGGISLPEGFCASVFADGIGHARQMALAPDGTLYVNTWSGRSYKNDKVPDGGFLVALRDKDGDGKAETIERFGETESEGGHGGTGLALYNDAVFAESNDRIMRYPLAKGEIAPQAKGETVVSGFPLTGDHPMHPFLITDRGEILAAMGSATNACEVKNRMPGSPGNEPCTEKETRAGVWRFDAGKTDQTFSPAERYALRKSSRSHDRGADRFATRSTTKVSRWARRRSSVPRRGSAWRKPQTCARADPEASRARRLRRRHGRRQKDGRRLSATRHSAQVTGLVS